MEELKSEEEFKNRINNGKTMMIFSAGWCPDCRAIEPALPEIEEAFPYYSFVEVDRDEFIDICQEYDVFGIPSFLAFNNGKETGRFVSKDRKTKEEVIRFIRSLPA